MARVPHGGTEAARPHGVIVVDTSAWVAFLRDTGSATCDAVDRALGGEFAISDAISMEVLAGARGERHLRKRVAPARRAAHGRGLNREPSR